MKSERAKGQVMLMVVVLLSGVLLGVTAIAGFLTLHQLRLATSAADSTRAIFAADTGVEWEFYKHFRCASAASSPTRCGEPPPVLANGEVFVTEPSPGGDSVKSTGYADSRKKIARAFELLFAAFE
ncbi:MAG: hypothetical protein HYV25_00350 [Candidatus Harrisonbacteria bacterium]|nr:hypothetical protein [Candidatus Harrisonbacteria bacterium]